jgi:hypothetical protein
MWMVIEGAFGRNGAGSCGGVKLVQSDKTAGSAADVGGITVVLLTVARMAETLR